MACFSLDRLPAPHEFEKGYVIGFDRLNTIALACTVVSFLLPFFKSF